jgi:hypothetical protein
MLGTAVIIRVYIILTMTMTVLSSGLRLVECGSEGLSADGEVLGGVVLGTSISCVCGGESASRESPP